jgi:hypothetical protein
VNSCSNGAVRVDPADHAVSNDPPIGAVDAAAMDTQPDLSFYFAIHREQLAAIDRYATALTTLTETERSSRGGALARWARGFSLELDEHHYVEDRFFFPSLRARVASAADILERLDAQHRHLDELLSRWRPVSRALADPNEPFAAARDAAVTVADELKTFLTDHLLIEDQDVLPLFWRHYTAAEYDAVVHEAVKKGKKAGMWFIAPFTVDCYPVGPARDAFLSAVPAILRLLHRLVRPRYDRLLATAFGPTLTSLPHAARAAG